MGNTDSRFNGEVFRKDHPMILAARRDLASLKPIKLAYNSAGYAAGTVLALNSTSHLHQAYDDNASSGLNTAVCVLMDEVKVDEFPGTNSAVDYQVARGVY